jgi:hypothetical protein
MVALFEKKKLIPLASFQSLDIWCHDDVIGNEIVSTCNSKLQNLAV